MLFQRVNNATPATPLVASSGVVANINDNNKTTLCEVQGVASTNEWFTMDLLASRRITKVDILQWYEKTGSDVNFSIRYSDSPINSGNPGTLFGSLFNATAYPTVQDTSQTGDATARYWAFVRAGNFVGVNVGIADFNLYGNQDFSGGII